MRTFGGPRSRLLKQSEQPPHPTHTQTGEYPHCPQQNQRSSFRYRWREADADVYLNSHTAGLFTTAWCGCVCGGGRGGIDSGARSGEQRERREGDDLMTGGVHAPAGRLQMTPWCPARMARRPERTRNSLGLHAAAAPCCDVGTTSVSLLPPSSLSRRLLRGCSGASLAAFSAPAHLADGRMAAAPRWV